MAVLLQNRPPLVLTVRLEFFLWFVGFFHSISLSDLPNAVSHGGYDTLTDKPALPKCDAVRHELTWTHHRLLTADPNAEANARLEIEASFPHGASDRTQRAVSGTYSLLDCAPRPPSRSACLHPSLDRAPSRALGALDPAPDKAPSRKGSESPLTFEPTHHVVLQRSRRRLPNLGRATLELSHDGLNPSSRQSGILQHRLDRCTRDHFNEGSRGHTREPWSLIFQFSQFVPSPRGHGDFA